MRSPMRVMSLSVTVALGAGLWSEAAESGIAPSGMNLYLVAISVADIDASASWYRDVLGLRLLEKKAFDQQGIKVAFLKSEDFRLELVELKNSVNPASCADISNPAALRGFGKLAFQVYDLGYVVRQLGRQGVTVLHDFRSDPVAEERSIIVKDVDGNWLQFFQRPGK